MPAWGEWRAGSFLENWKILRCGTSISHLLCLRQELLFPAVPAHNGNCPCQPWVCSPVLGQLGVLQATSHPRGIPWHSSSGSGPGAHRESWGCVWADTTDPQLDLSSLSPCCGESCLMLSSVRFGEWWWMEENLCSQRKARFVWSKKAAQPAPGKNME